MIKSALLAQPIYYMSCYKLPKRVISTLQGILAVFGKNQNPNQKKLTWDSWKNVCLSKDQGGIHLDLFNQVLLAKNGWKLVLNSQSLSGKILNDKYYPHTDLLRTTKGRNLFYIWSSLLWGRQLLTQGLGWKTGIGDKIEVWNQNWIPSESFSKPYVNNSSSSRK